MNKMMVLARATDGEKAELARWYDERHIPDLLAVAGFVSAERHDALAVKLPAEAESWDFMLIYEFSGDPMATLGAMGNLMGSEKMPVTPILDSSRTVSIVGMSHGRRTA
jgi:hypothetical protein